MRIDKAIERLMMMDGASWARHASPWSFWTRVPVLALLALAIWSRVWVGWWCVVPIGLVGVWTLVNPRAFPGTSHTEQLGLASGRGRTLLAGAQVHTDPGAPCESGDHPGHPVGRFNHPACLRPVGA